MFKIIGGDGKVYGPVTEDHIRQWISEGRANGDTQVLSEGDQQWKPLSAFPQFGFAASSPTEPPPLVRTGFSNPKPYGVIKVFAVLNIIFGSFSLLCAPFSIFGMSMGLQEFGNNPALKLWLPISAFLGLIGGAIELSSGIGLLKLRSWARKLAVYYALFDCVTNVIGPFITARPLTSSSSLAGLGQTGGVVLAISAAVIAFTYDILLIAFLTKRSAREAVGEVMPEAS